MFVSKIKLKIKWLLKDLFFLKAYLTPFKRPKLVGYFGKTQIGVPYFLPRKVKNQVFVPKKIGFDFLGLGGKTKGTDSDYRFEWSPMLSFVFFGYQIVVKFIPPHTGHYGECWLYYMYNTDKNQPSAKRLKQAKKEFPCVGKVFTSKDLRERTICYGDLILK